MKQDIFGDRMKAYEQAEAGRKFLPRLPIVVRLDGKGFSKYTKNLNRPYDTRFSEIMVEVTKFLVDNTGARVGYTQSDEISLIYYADDVKQYLFFDGKIQKIISVLASMATAIFNNLATQQLPTDLVHEYAFFDCRAWVVPSKDEAANAILWREYDATKNSRMSACRAVYSHKAMLNKSTNEQLDMLLAKGINWNNYPASFKRGVYVQRREVERELTANELAKIPEAHRPVGAIKRNEVRVIEMPVLSKVVNRVDVLFDGAVPEVADE